MLGQAISLSYCTYDLTITTGADALWLWTDVTDSTSTDQTFSALQSIYDSSEAGTYTVELQYSWADTETSSVTITITVTDPCPAAIVAPSGAIT